MSLRFECRYCKYTTPKFKELIDHYVAYHQGQGLKRYQIRNRIKGNSSILNATSADEACKACGWRIDDCFVKELNKESSQQ